MDHEYMEVIAVFDIGRTWKRFCLFDRNLQPVLTEEKILGEITDSEGLYSSELPVIEKWIHSCLNGVITGETYSITAVNVAAAREYLSRLNEVINMTLKHVSQECMSFQGEGIECTSASLLPYLAGSDNPFIMVSTGTWCTFMNPFSPLPAPENDPERGLAGYMTVGKTLVKVSHFMLGEIHDHNVAMLDDHFGVTGELYKTIKIKHKKVGKIQAARRGRVFFRHGIPEGMADTSAGLSHFLTYADAYHQMMYDLVDECLEAYRLVSSGDESTEIVYVTGGFARNDTFVRTLAARIPEKRVYASTIEYATALGAAIEVYPEAFGTELPPLWLGLKAILLRDD